MDLRKVAGCGRAFGRSPGEREEGRWKVQGHSLAGTLQPKQSSKAKPETQTVLKPTLAMILSRAQLRHVCCLLCFLWSRWQVLVALEAVSLGCQGGGIGPMSHVSLHVYDYCLIRSYCGPESSLLLGTASWGGRTWGI